MKSKDARPGPLENLADALTEDILNTPDDELLREVEEDYGNPRAMANKFDQLLEGAEKQVFGTARSAASPAAASPQERSSVLDLLISLPDEMIRWIKGIFDLGSRLSKFLSSLRPRTLAWSATAAAIVILVQAAVITAVLVKKQGASSGPSFARGDVPSRAKQPPMEAAEAVGPQPVLARISSPRDEEIAAFVAGGRQLMVAGDIPNARLVLQRAAEAGNATAVLELGATYDPTILQEQKARVGPTKASVPAMADMADIRIARLLYEKARDLGSTEAAVRLEKLRSVPSPGR